jgi:site-specific recombinase XerD
MNSAFQDLLQKFFLKRMMNQKQASPETIKSYRDTFRIYIEYLNIVHKCPPHKISIEHIQAEYILGFLEYLDHERGNQTVDAHIIWRPLDNRQWRLSWNAK